MIIEQALFGYKNGHRLLASSFCIPQEAIKVLEPLSDSSGTNSSGINDGFFVGYPLEKLGYFCLGKIWNAYEIGRPGCVWTHMIFIPLQGDAIIDTYELERLFSRPELEDCKWEEKYKYKIQLQSSKNPNFQRADIDLTYYCEKIISEITVGHTPLVIKDSRYTTYNVAILTLLGSLPIDFFSKISFCTYSLSYRSIHNIPLTIQVTPNNLAKLKRNDDKAYMYNEIGEVKSRYTYDRIKKATKIGIDQFKFFSPEMLRFFLDNLVDEEYLIRANIDNVVHEAMEIFDSKEKQEHIILLLYQKWFKNVINMMDKYIMFCSLPIENTQLFSQIDDSAIKKSLRPIFDKENKEQLLYLTKNLVEKDINRVGEKSLEYISTGINEEILGYFFEHGFYTIYPLIGLNKKIALHKCIWEQQYEIQCEVLKAVERYCSSENEINISSLLSMVFEISNKNIEKKIFELYGNESIEVFFECLNQSTYNSNLYRHVSICNNNIVLSVNKLSDLRSEIAFKNVIAALDAYSPELLSINIDYWWLLYTKFCKQSNDESIQETFAKFIFPIVLQSNKQFPYELIRFTFLTVHDILLRDGMPYYEWDKLSTLLPEVAFYKMWDKCIRVRKAAKNRGYDIDFDNTNS